MSIKPINVVLNVEPVAKGRARVVIKGGRAMAYTPEKTRTAETEIRLMIRQHLMNSLHLFDGEQYFPAEMPLRMEALFLVPRPPSAPTKRFFPVNRPDCDNYLKTLLDSLNKFIFADDSQLTTIIVKKRYGLIPSIHLRIEEDKQ